MRAAVDLAAFRFGPGDPTTRIDASGFWRATITPDGPGTLHLRVVDGVAHAEAWGDGAEWLLASVGALMGADDPGFVFVDAHPAILAAQRSVGEVRFGASHTLYHELLPAVLGQRVTAGEAVGQWHRLVRALGQPSPGPDPTLLLPPAPDLLAGQPLWWFRPLGIESKRAATLREIATHADRLFEWADAGPTIARQKLALLRGVGPWTIALAVAAALGDPDAVAVGDFHLKNVIVHTLTGRPRGTDEEMLELLAPYLGQRGRVVRLLLQAGASAPEFGPRRRVESIGRR